jgi:hypothetical protein
MADRYLRGVLTLIAACLVYLCVILTPWPRVHAQDALSGAQPVVIVGFRSLERRRGNLDYVVTPITEGLPVREKSQP